ncbi:MAG: hypothetical protein WBZ20_18670 [Nitrososphaeraceae archaeon]
MTTNGTTDKDIGLSNRDSRSEDGNTLDEDTIALDLNDTLQKEQIVRSFTVNKKSQSIVVRLNHKDKQMTVVSTLYSDWNKTINSFSVRAKEKGVDNNHVLMLTDALDDNNGKVMECFFSQRNGNGNDDQDRKDKEAVALELIKGKVVELFLDEVKAPYAAIRVNEHVETMPIESKRFEDWVGAAYYHYQKAEGKDIVLSKEGIGKIQSILRFETNSNNDEGKENVKTLHLRVAAFIDSKEVYYDFGNPKWEIAKITPEDWEIIKQHERNIFFKRFAIMNAQVYPKRDYPADIFDQFMKLTNVYNDEDNKLLASVYLISLFLLESLPKPMMLPHGTHGSAKSTFQEFIKLIVDPSAALTTAFPSDIKELVQALSHSYVTFFDNVSEIKEITSDQLCRVVTGSGFTKRGLYTDDEDIIYNMKRVVGYNGINVTATRADLLDRILTLHLKPIDKRNRRKLSALYKDFNNILPHLLGYIFDMIVKVLNRIDEVKLEEFPRMADFAEMGELISRCLGYSDGKFTEAYNRNIGFTNEEAVDANSVATAVRILMSTQAIWSGKNEDLRLKLNDMVSNKRELNGMLYSRGWPKTPHALSDRLNEITPSLKEIGIVIHKEFDAHTKSNTITIVNNNYEFSSNKDGSSITDNNNINSTK